MGSYKMSKYRGMWPKIVGGKTSLGYICVVCRSANDGKYDFLMGTESLKQVIIILQRIV